MEEITGNYNLSPYLPLNNSHWFDTYRLPNSLIFEEIPNKLSDDQVLVYIWASKVLNLDIAKYLLKFFPLGKKCYKCSRFVSIENYEDIQLKFKNYSICNKCFSNLNDIIIPQSIQKIITFNPKDIFPLSVSLNTTLDALQYKGKVLDFFLFELRLTGNQRFHILFDYDGYLMALEIKDKWYKSVNTLYPILTEWNFLNFSIRGIEWLVNKRRFGFL